MLGPTGIFWVLISEVLNYKVSKPLHLRSMRIFFCKVPLLCRNFEILDGGLNLDDQDAHLTAFLKVAIKRLMLTRRIAFLSLVTSAIPLVDLATRGGCVGWLFGVHVVES